MVQGVSAANDEFDTNWHVARIWYVEAESPYVTLYRLAAYRIVEKLSKTPEIFTLR